MSESGHSAARSAAAARAALDATRSTAAALDAALAVYRLDAITSHMTADQIAEDLGLSRSAAEGVLADSAGGGGPILSAIGGRSLRVLQFVCSLAVNIPQSQPGLRLACEPLGVSEFALRSVPAVAEPVMDEWSRRAQRLGVTLHWSHTLDAQEAFPPEASD